MCGMVPLLVSLTLISFSVENSRSFQTYAPSGE